MTPHAPATPSCRTCRGSGIETREGCVCGNCTRTCRPCGGTGEQPTLHAPDITEDDQGFWHAACACGWCELQGHAYREVAADHHDDHVAELDVEVAGCTNPDCRGGEISYPEWEGQVEPCPDCGGAEGAERDGDDD